MNKVKCIFTDTLKYPCTTPDGKKRTTNNSLLYPENKLSIKEQVAFKPEDYSSRKDDDIYIVTNSPFIVSCFKSYDVYIYDLNKDDYTKPEPETYGASFDSLLVSLSGLDILIASKPLKEIKSILSDSDHNIISPKETLKHLEKFGESFELNFRRNKLKLKNK